MDSVRQAWVAFLLSSALLVGTLLPVINYGHVFIYYPIFVLFGCDSARSSADCVRIQLTPFVPPALTVVALISCRIAIGWAWYATGVLVAAVACATSWLFILGGFR